MALRIFGSDGKGSFGLRPRTSPRRISLLVGLRRTTAGGARLGSIGGGGGRRPPRATIRSWSERTISHTGTETRPRLLREAAVGNLAQRHESTVRDEPRG